MVISDLRLLLVAPSTPSRHTLILMQTTEACIQCIAHAHMLPCAQGIMYIWDLLLDVRACSLL